jgi:hypothetical protein
LGSSSETLDNRKDQPNFQFSRRQPMGQRTNQILFVVHAEAQ